MPIEPAPTPTRPVFRVVADHAVLVEFEDKITDEAHAAVLSLDTHLSAAPFAGFVEAVPAFVNILIEFDCVQTDHNQVIFALKSLLANKPAKKAKGKTRDVAICYDPDFAPDLAEVSKRSGLSEEAVIAAHLAGDYRVFMYGFAPGYAYLGGLPDALVLDRKPMPVRGVAKGSVIIAGRQCLVTTLVMPTGWWIIGRSPTQILTKDRDNPFLVDVGDHVKFRRISRDEFERRQS